MYDIIDMYYTSYIIDMYDMIDMYCRSCIIDMYDMIDMYCRSCIIDYSTTRLLPCVYNSPYTFTHTQVSYNICTIICTIRPCVLLCLCSVSVSVSSECR